MTLFDPSKISVVFFRGVTICRMSLFRRFKISKINFFPMMLDTCSKFFLFISRIITNSFKSRSIIFMNSSVRVVLGRCCLPKIFYFIIGSIRIYVINFIWPYAIKMKPCDSVLTVYFFVNLYSPVSTRLTSSPFAEMYYAIKVRRIIPKFPNEYSCFWIIVQNRSNIFRSKVIAFIVSWGHILLSHLESPFRSLVRGATRAHTLEYPELYCPLDMNSRGWV